MTSPASNTRFIFITGGVVSSLGKHIIRILTLFYAVALLPLAGCVAPPDTTSNGVSYTHDGFLTEREQSQYDEDKAMIGHRYWIPSYLADVCDSPQMACPQPYHQRKRGSFYGPFTITDVIKSDITIYYVIKTPDGSTKYLWDSGIQKRHMVSEDPHVKHAKAKAECDRRGGVSIGMTEQQVLASCWGKPLHKNISQYSFGTHEQWVYRGGYLYFEDGILTSTQTTH